MMTLDEAVKKVRPLDEKAMEGARKRWDSIAKPLHSLGELENMLTQIAGITGTPEVRVEKKAVVAMCADNGVVEEGVTQTGQEVTAVVAENFLEGTTTCCVMCRQCGAELFPVDVGMVTDTKVRTDLKVAYGTRNMTREPAMTRDQAIRGIEAGIAMAEELKEKGGQVIGINTDSLDGNEDGIAEAKSILEKQGAKYTNLSLDSNSEAGKYATGIMAFPTTIVLDRNGNIIGEPIMGGIDNDESYKQLMKTIDQILAADKN
mgnify:CR=1 FL=1